MSLWSSVWKVLQVFPKRVQQLLLDSPNVSKRNVYWFVWERVVLFLPSVYSASVEIVASQCWIESKYRVRCCPTVLIIVATVQHMPLTNHQHHQWPTCTCNLYECMFQMRRFWLVQVKVLHYKCAHTLEATGRRCVYTKLGNRAHFDALLSSHSALPSSSSVSKSLSVSLP